MTVRYYSSSCFAASTAYSGIKAGLTSAAGIPGSILGSAYLVHNYLIIEEHGKLMYPEAMNISETLVASDTGGESIKYMGDWFWDRWYNNWFNKFIL